MTPRTRSTLSTEGAPHPPHAQNEPTTIETETIPSDLDLNLAATQATIEKLQRLKDLQDQAERLRSEVLGRRPDDFLSNSYREPYYPSGKDQEIELKNLPIFTLDYTLQKRQEWLLDLQQMFEGAPKRYYDDRTKILGAISYMNQTCRQRWYRHAEEKGSTTPRNLKEDWPYFRDWTLTLIKNVASLESDVMGQLERTYQYRDEDPREFHARLDTLEQHFPRSAEKERALSYFAKLQYPLQNTIRRHVIKLPETREDMIDIAYHFWDINKTEEDRKRKRNGRSPEPSRKKTQREFPPNPTREQGRLPYPRRDSYRGRYRGSYRGGSRQKSNNNNPTAHEMPTKDHRNPTEGGWKRNTCYKCGSPDHYADTCPKRSSEKPVTVQSAQQGNGSETE